MNGSVGILNVGAGDTKLIFDKNSPADCIRAARIVKDMLRRGYALLVEVEQPNGTKAFQRALDFREDTYEYIIADFDPIVAAETDARDEHEPEGTTTDDAGGAPRAEEIPAPPKPRGRGSRKSIDATKSRGVAIARSAGG